MITLYTFGPGFGLPDPSPFVTKADVLLQMSGCPYECKRADVRKAPKAKLPYINDDGTLVADSTFILTHLEKTYGVDLDKRLTAQQRAIGWAFEKMCEEHLYWAVVDARWMVDKNFDNGPRAFFNIVPAPLRPLVAAKVRRDVKRTLHGQGFGRHSRTEIEDLARRDLVAISDFLADKKFLFGDEPASADASVFASVACALCPHFDTPIRRVAETHPNLADYVRRCMQRWYPELANAKTN